MNLLGSLQERFRAGLAQNFKVDIEPLVAMIRQAQDTRFGDYQANCAMPLGKQLGRPPRDVAQELVDQVDLSELCETVEVAGPGFVNLRLSTAWLQEQLQVMRNDERLGVAQVPNPRCYVVDYSSPNVAKPMHVGHIRSTVIGDSLCRTLRFLGHQVVSDNHLGDWGTQFGMIIYGFRHFANDRAYREKPVDELSRVYREVRGLMDFHEGIASLPRGPGEAQGVTGKAGDCRTTAGVGGR